MVGIETAAALPDDVVLEVLVRVADVATLFRCATVCKLWRRLIADCSFLRRRWPEGIMRPTRPSGFFTRQRLHAKEDEDLLVGVDEVGDPESPSLFVSVRRSPLDPGRRSFPGSSTPAGLLNGATSLTSRGGLLLVRLAPHDDRGPVNLAVWEPFAGTCDVLPPLVSEPTHFLGYAILTSEDCCSPNEPRTAPVVAIGLARDNGILDWNLHRFSSTEPSWAFSRKRLDIDDSTSYFTIDARSDDGDVSLTKLTLPLPAIKPTFEYFHMAGLDGALSLYFLYTETKEGLGLEIWTRGKGADWYLARVVELRQRIEGVLYLWPGEKSDTLLINSDAEDMYVAYLDTGAVEKITSEFHGLTTDDAVPMEIDWQSLFMSRLGGP
ncbi:hypothetical protein VPH35_055981 [Triticum aestivum]